MICGTNKCVVLLKTNKCFPISKYTGLNREVLTSPKFSTMGIVCRADTFVFQNSEDIFKLIYVHRSTVNETKNLAKDNNQNTSVFLPQCQVHLPKYCIDYPQNTVNKTQVIMQLSDSTQFCSLFLGISLQNKLSFLEK